MGGKPHAPQHAQRVVRESDVGVERRANDAVFEVVKAIEGVDKLPEVLGVKTNGHSVDGKVAAVLVVFQRSVLHDRLTRVVTVTFFSRSNELNFVTAKLHLGRAEIAKHRYVRLLSKAFAQCVGHLYATSHHNYVDVVRRSLQEKVANIPSYHITRHTEGICRIAYFMENVLV